MGEGVETTAPETPDGSGGGWLQPARATDTKSAATDNLMPIRRTGSGIGSPSNPGAGARGDLFLDRIEPSRRRRLP